MIYRNDGSVESANTPTIRNTMTVPDYNKYRCLVTEVLFVDSPRNLTRNSPNPRVLYNCVILGGFRSGNTINNCRVQSTMGSPTAFYERVLKATTVQVGEGSLSNHDGEIVYVEFVQGDRNFPVIVGYDNSFAENPMIGANSEQGPRLLESFHGITTEINNVGEYSISRTGGTFEEECFVPAEVEEPQALLQMFENLIKLANPNQSIELLQEELMYQHSIGENLEDPTYQEVIDGSTNEIGTRSFKSGLTITEDGQNDKMEILTKAGVRILVDGGNDTVEIKDGGSGTLKITDNTVALGANGIELLQQISDSLSAIADWAQSVGGTHNHLGNLGYPTAPPTQTADYISLGTDLQAIMADIDSIKGSL